MPPSNPNFGTGYVDWSSYVNANQPNIQADRSKVQKYLQGEDTQTRNQATNAFGQTGYAPQGVDANNNSATGGSQTQGSQSAVDWSTLQNELYTNQAALQDSGGFSQVLAKANANYNPLGKAAAPQAAYDPFSSALEGQNAGALYSGAGDAQKFAEGITKPTGPDPNQAHPYNPAPTYGNSGNNQTGEGPAGKPGRDPDNQQAAQDNGYNTWRNRHPQKRP